MVAYINIKLLTYFLSIALASASNKGYKSEKFSVAFEWNFLNYTWPSPEALAESTYVPGEDIIAGIKIYRNIIYLALPRVKKSARVTLASIPLNANKENPLLTPYPSWKMNTGEGCDTLQNVLSMEIDRKGIMWVLDARRDGNVTKCPPRIVLLDLNNNGKVVRNFIVPDKLCPHARGCFLNDIAVDGDFAYISDTTVVDPGIFVYNMELNKAWKFRDASVRGDPAAAYFVAQGVVKNNTENINGITLSPNCCKNRLLYYMPMSSFSIYSILTSVLKNPSRAHLNITGYVQKHSTKQAQSGGMMGDDQGYIYYGLLPLDAVGRWNTRKSLSTSKMVEQNSKIIRWPDSFAFDLDGNLYLITNSILSFSVNGIDINDVNFRILKLRTGTRSYLYCHNPRNH